MQKFINTFSGGIERDISINKYDNTHYFDAKNFTIMSDRELSNYALLSIKGALEKANVSGVGIKMLGYTFIRDYIIMFMSAPDGGRIYRFKDTGSDFPVMGEMELVYTDPALVFDPNLPIRAVGRYETEDIQKVYFTDTENFFYHLNTIHDPVYNNLTGVGGTKIPVNALDLVADVYFNPIQYEVEKGGNLTAGRIQYAYQFYNVHGAETVFSSASPLINLTSYDDNDNSTLTYRGNKAEEVVNKSVKVTIPIRTVSDPVTFIRLRLVALHYDSDILEPKVRIVGEYNISDTLTFSVTDTGQSIGTLTPEEFRFVQQDFIPKTLETRQNILFPGNITTNYFNITDQQFDTRVFRFNPAGNSVINQGDIDKERTISASTYQSDISAIPYDDPCYNVFNDLDQDQYRYNPNASNKTTDYRFKRDGLTLGGEGVNISYEFVTTPRIIDSDPQRYKEVNLLKTSYGYPKLQVKVDSPFDNYAHYRTSAEYVGYQRDEIYSFAIVLYDSKGRQSFAKWIGDIRFPDNETHPIISYDFDTEHTIANILGIKFSLTETAIQTLISLGVTSFQIVRCERRSQDKTVRAAGLFAYPYQRGDGDDNANKMFTVSSFPIAGDCQQKKIITARYSWADTVLFPDGVLGGEVIGNNTVYPLTDKFVEFTSPEISFDKKLNTTNSDILEVNGYFDVNSSVITMDRRASDVHEYRGMVIADKYKGFGSYPKGGIGYPNKGLPFTRVTNKTSKVFTQVDSQYQPSYTFPDGGVYTKQTFNGVNGDNNRHGLRGTHLISKVSDNQSWYLPDTFVGKDGTTYHMRVMYGYYRYNSGKGIYGGTDYYSRLNRTYYKASDVISLTTTTSTIEQGSSTSTDPVGVGTAVIEDQIFVTFENTLSGTEGWVAWVVNITLPEATAVDTTFGFYFEALRLDKEGYLAHTSYLTVPQGNTTYTFNLVAPGTIGLEGIETESWIIQNQYINYMSPNTQYTLASSVAPPSREIITVTETLVDGVVVFGGDTYIDYHIDHRGLWDYTRTSNGRRSIKSMIMFPVESQYNLSLRLDDVQGFTTWHAHADVFPEGTTITNDLRYHVQEKLSQGIAMWGTDYPTDLGDLYRYNRAYIATDKSKIFIPEPFDFKNRSTMDTRVLASDLKISGEYSDSWLKYKPNSYIDVDSQYGELIRILNVAEKLVYFQPDGVGILSVNDRALIEDNNVGKITLGSGGILPRFDYISYTTGITVHDAAVKADAGFHYIDSQRKRIYTYSGNEQPTSFLKGVNSLLNEMPFAKVLAGFEPKLNRVYFTIDNMTLVYNEVGGRFSHRAGFVPDLYITKDNAFYTVMNFGEEKPLLANDFTNTDYDDNGNPILIADGSEGATLFKHGNGPTGDYYSTGDGAESYVHFIIHPDNVTKCVFDTLEFTMEVVDNNDVEVYTDSTDTYQPIFSTIERLEFSNSYMSKTVNIEYGKNIKKVGKTWRVQVPLVADRKVPTRTNRFVDTYLMVKLVFNNSTYNRLRIHDITTYYRPLQV